MSLAVTLVCVLLLALVRPLCAQTNRAIDNVPPQQLAVEAAALAVRDLEPLHSFLRYRSRVINSKGDLTRDTIESRDGSVARLILVNGHALTAAEDQAECQRLQAMLDSPAAFARHVKSEQSGRKQATDIIRMIPDAMIFKYAEGQPQPSASLAAPEVGRPGTPKIALEFHPNPNWSPPGMAAETLTGLEGRMWLDPQTHHVTDFQINVFRAVNVGFGMLAKVFPAARSS